ncbi:putative ATPase [Actinocorallia herbida]|uniref:Putative ATPase n=1 Tax=Actinocorallia herbida TaxID=58109 RepID=A0A3N1CZ86_9ACTN|nr:helix-turn-helix domain-containing protein [Actinocorallia herbida]ROO86604.1 putative ATPase [Actinocorallia herbida]
MRPAGAFAAHLRRFRQAAALSQEELAERAGLTAKAVGSLERGERRRPYPTTVRALADALGLADEDRRILAEAAQGGSPPPAPPEPRAAPVIGRTAFPVPPTPILGRDRELAEVVALLRTGPARLVTVTGPGGVGKTRLAWEVAAALRGDGGGAAVAAELASVLSAELVLPTVARAVGLHAATGDPTDAIAAFLGDRAQVVVLDNLEHVLEIAPGIADLLGRCPGLVILATSRAPLRIRAEQEYPLAPLGLPREADVNAVAWSAAAQLFADRARAVAPDFTIDHRNAAAVAAICRRLDGLPLALELAASHLRHLPPAQLLTRLDTALGTARLRDLPTRQRTMGATLDWSYQLLTDAEQSLLRALSVFRGGFDLDAVEAVVGGTGVLPALDGLVDQSLVAPQAPGRYRLLEPVRHYAAALADPVEAAALAERHARYHAELGRDARAGLRGADQGAWLDRLEETHANLRSALRTLIAAGDLATAARLGGDTWLYWALRGHAGEGIRWWEQILALADEGGLDGLGRAAARVALAGLRLATGDIAAVREMPDTAVADARAGGDQGLLADALILWSMASVFAGDLAEAGSRVAELSALVGPLGDPWAAAHARIVEAQLLLLRGEPGASVAALDAAERTARGAELAFTLATALNMQATLALHADDDGAALRHLTEATRLAVEVRTTWTLVYSLSALAGVAVRHAEPAVAASLFAAASATAEASLLTVAFRPDSDAAETQLDALRRRLPEEEFRRAWEHGRTLRTDEVLDLVARISVRRGPG